MLPSTILAMATSNASFLGNLPILDGKNWERWCTQMEVVVDYQDVLEIVQNEFQELGEAPEDAVRAAHKEARKNNCKALLLIHQSVDNAHFQKISFVKNAKQAWDILVQCYDGGDKLKEVKL